MSEFEPTPLPQETDPNYFADQVGLTNGQFNVPRHNGDVVQGWVVDGLEVQDRNGVPTQIVSIIDTVPAKDEHGNIQVDENGAPMYASKRYPINDLLSFQDQDKLEKNTTDESGVFEIGQSIVESEVEITDIDDPDRTLTREEINRLNESARVDEVQEITSSESEDKEPEIEDSVNTGITGPASEQIGAIKDSFIDASSRFDSIHSQLEDLPRAAEKLLGDFIENQSVNFNRTGNILSNVKSLAEPFRNIQSLLRSLEGDVHGQVDESTRQTLRSTLENSQQLLRGINELIRTTSEGRSSSGRLQNTVSDNLRTLSRNLEGQLEAFNGVNRENLDNGLNQGYDRINEAATEDSLDETGAIGKNKDELDHYDYDKNRVGKFTGSAIDEVGEFGSSIKHKLDFDFTGMILDSSGLSSNGLDEALRAVEGFSRTLDSLTQRSSGSTKGNILAELSTATATDLKRALDIIDRMRVPTAEYSEQSTATSWIKNRTKDILAVGDQLESYLHDVKRDIVNGVRS